MSDANETTEAPVAVEPDPEVRRQLEDIARRAREQAADGDRTLADRIGAGILNRIERGERDRAAAEAAEIRRVKAGERPLKLEHESRDDWMQRLGAWQATPAGREWMVARAQEAQAAADADRRDRWSEILQETGVPAGLAERIWEGIGASQPLNAIRLTVFRILVLAGNVGTGKSMAAAWWLLAPHLPGTPIEKGPRGRLPSLWVSAARLARWERYDDTEMQRLLCAPRLVIDDLGTEFTDAKGNSDAIIDEVVNDRLSNKRPLVITTNLTADVFRKRYGERIADRIREHGEFLAFIGENFRRRQG